MANLITNEHLKIKYQIETALHKKYGISPTALNSRNREQDVARVRFIAFFLLYNKFKMTTPLIAKLYEKDHTTILNGLSRVEELGLKKEALELSLSTYPQ